MQTNKNTLNEKKNETIIEMSERSNECYICQEEGDLYNDNCKCKDLFYHKECLYKWLINKQSVICEICKEKYNNNLINELIIIEDQKKKENEENMETQTIITENMETQTIIAENIQRENDETLIISTNVRRNPYYTEGCFNTLLNIICLTIVASCIIVLIMYYNNLL
mgnify:CR=1 FL=1